MEYALRITIFEGLRQVFTQDIVGVVELGRQRKDEPGPISTQQTGDGTRIVVAELTETAVSRQQVRLEPRPDGNFLIRNSGTNSPIQLKPPRTLEPGQSWVCVNTTRVQLGNRLICMESVPLSTGDEENPTGDVLSLSSATILPGARFGFDSDMLKSVRSTPIADQFEPMIRSLQAAVDVFQSINSSTDFYRHAVQAVVDLVGLDTGRVLLWQGDRWRMAAMATDERHEGVTASQVSSSVLNKVKEQKRTLWQLGNSQDVSASLINVQSVVASPILNRQGEIIGVLYGDRGYGGFSAEREITRFEAMLVELLACSVASGLLRVEQEEALQAQRLRFEQFQSRKLAEQLERQPDLLKGREVEVSVLFVDIRKFSKISETLGAETTFEWINDVMSTLSECVNETDGIIVDYVGDEIMAMWGAPDQQPDHAVRACTAALKMFEQIPLINAKWKTVLPFPCTIGIGINSGPARAGNIGSHRKFKYGPLGNTVNVASRMQGCTKYLRCPCVISATTLNGLGPEWSARRLCDARVVNISQPIPLYELTNGQVPNWGALREKYEAAHAAFQQRDFRKAVALLGDLLERFPDDGPSLVLVSRAVQALLDGAENFDPVWNLPGK